MFDVNCHICTGSDQSSHPSSLTNVPGNCQPAALPDNGDSLPSDVGRSDHSPRKKIKLAQRLKMYSTELERNSISNANQQVGGKCVSEMVSDADIFAAKMAAVGDVKPNIGVHEVHSSHEPALDKPQLAMNVTEQQVQTVHKLQNESPVEQRNSHKQNAEERSSVVHDKPQKDCVAKSRSGTAKQKVDYSTSTGKFDALHKAEFKKNHVAARYVCVSFCCC